MANDVNGEAWRGGTIRADATANVTTAHDVSFKRAGARAARLVK
jgi:hypothetical protein